VVRRFVKPVQEVQRGPDGAVLALSGQPVTEVGPDRLPVLASAAGYLDCRLTSALPLGSHVFCIGEVIGVGGEPGEVLRMEDTRMHYGG
jgi:flavin reductase (DIM6/NTAB) family NADH-FMN oxidoreductase RutF